MFNWKLFGGVIGGTLLMVGLAAWGLMGMGGDRGGVQVPIEELVGGVEWVIGDENAKVVVVEFACPQCSACKAAEPMVEKLRQMEGVRYVWRFFPLVNTHKNSLKASRAAQAARRMDKGWEMIDLLFEKQGEWANVDFEEKLDGYVVELGLEKEAFYELYGSEGVAGYIAGDAALADKLKLNGTPTFFVNGKLVPSQLVISEVEKLLKK